MNFRKDFLIAESRKLLILAVLLILRQAAPAIQKSLMGHHFQAPEIDFIYVLAVSFLPTAIYSAISLVIFSFLLSIIKMKIIPTHLLEKKYFGLKSTNLVAAVIYAAILVIVLYAPNYITIKSSFSDFSGVLFSKIGVPAESFWMAILSVIYAAVVAPLYVFFPLKIYSVFAGALYALFFVHLLSVRTVEMNTDFCRSCTPRISEEGGWVAAKTKVTSKFPVLSYVGISQEFRKNGVTKKESVTSSSDIYCMRSETENKYLLSKGFYSSDIAEFWVVTPPFFSKVYRTSRTEASATIIPKSPDLHAVRSPPVALESRGNVLSKKMTNSSTDFAGIKEYVPGDQLNRIWWQGFARTGTLLTKSYYSTGEDSIILLPDLTEPDTENGYGDAVMSALANIVNICSKKDISIAIYPICNHKLRIEATRNKKELMFFIMNLGAITNLSPEGADKIFDSALSHDDYVRLRERCKKNNITLGSLYGASAVAKRGTPIFSWDRKSVFSSSAKNFFKYQGKRAKVILLTNSKIPLPALEDFRNLCISRKFRYVAVALEKGGIKKDLERLEEARRHHIFAVPMTYEDAKKISKIYSTLGERIL